MMELDVRVLHLATASPARALHAPGLLRIPLQALADRARQLTSGGAPKPPPPALTKLTTSSRRSIR